MRSLLSVSHCSEPSPGPLRSLPAGNPKLPHQERPRRLEKKMNLFHFWWAKNFISKKVANGSINKQVTRVFPKGVGFVGRQSLKSDKLLVQTKHKNVKLI